MLELYCYNIMKMVIENDYTYSNNIMDVFSALKEVNSNCLLQNLGRYKVVLH